MDIQTRKIAFMQEFLKIQDEELILRLEKIIKAETEPGEPVEFQPMSVEELERRIALSENDFRNKRYKTSALLLSKY